MAMKELYLRFAKFVEKQALFSGVDHILAAVSGGVDSMTMLHCLLRYSHETNLNLQVAHFNHQLRGQQSDRDEFLVHEYCLKNELKYHLKQSDVSSVAKAQGLSVEMAGRRLRYQFLQDIARELENSIIATGHTLDDHVETVLMRIIKGTGWQGICGIPIKRNNIVRPLRFARKKELYNYAHVHHISFHEDHTNFGLTGQRNILRNEVIPLLTAKINPRFHQAIDQLSEIGLETYQWINAEAEKYYKDVVVKESNYQITLEISNLRSYAIAVKKGVILHCISVLEGKPSPQYNYLIMNNLLDLVASNATGKYLKVSENVWANIDRGTLILMHRQLIDWEDMQVEIDTPYDTVPFRFKAAFVKREDCQFNKSPDLEFIDYDKLEGKFKLRHWQPGDSFQPLGFNHQKKVSDLFVDHKISRFKKKQIPILVDHAGIVWVCGLRLAERVKVTPSTRKLVKLIYEEKYG